MTRLKSEFLNVLHERGCIHQCTDLESLDQKAQEGIITGYIGFDATADSLHVGNLAGIMLLRRMQQTGHRPIVLMGGGTTKVGDPSDKTGMRAMMSDDQISSNITSIQEIFNNFLTFGKSNKDALLVNNAAWLDRLEYIPFLREIGQHFTINRMIAFDFVKRRLEQELPLTFLEFNYMIMQGYDFVELNRHHNCILQMGGSDQWGNIVNGVELGRRINNCELFGLTTPLITTSSGAKMGKTVTGAVWLKGDKLSPYHYWQFWRNSEDADVVRFLKIFTDLTLDEIGRLEKLQGSEINEAKKILAFEATKLAHGETAAKSAADTAREVFEKGGQGLDLPTHEISKKETIPVVDVAVLLKISSSKSEAKRLVEQGGVYLNDAPVKSITTILSIEDADSSGVVRLSFGKKKHAILKFI